MKTRRGVSRKGQISYLQAECTRKQCVEVEKTTGAATRDNDKQISFGDPLLELTITVVLRGDDLQELEALEPDRRLERGILAKFGCRRITVEIDWVVDHDWQNRWVRMDSEKSFVEFQKSFAEPVRKMAD